MMKPKSIQEYCGAVSDVADDFITHLENICYHKGVITNLENALFKYSLEVKYMFWEMACEWKYNYYEV